MTWPSVDTELKREVRELCVSEGKDKRVRDVGSSEFIHNGLKVKEKR